MAWAGNVRKASPFLEDNWDSISGTLTSLLLYSTYLSFARPTISRHSNALLSSEQHTDHGSPRSPNLDQHSPTHRSRRSRLPRPPLVHEQTLLPFLRSITRSKKRSRHHKNQPSLRCLPPVRSPKYSLGSPSEWRKCLRHDGKSARRERAGKPTTEFPTEYPRCAGGSDSDSEHDGCEVNGSGTSGFDSAVWITGSRGRERKGSSPQ